MLMQLKITFARSLVKKNKVRNGVQQFKCYVCKKQFTGGERKDFSALASQYVKGKQTYSDLSKLYGVSVSAIKRKFKFSIVR